MKVLTLLPFFLLAAIPAPAQIADPQQAEIDRLSQMAALMPASAEFDDAWKAYVGRFVSDMSEADAAIEEIRQGADEFQRKVRVPGGSAGPAMSGHKLREKMRALAAEVLETQIPEE